MPFPIDVSRCLAYAPVNEPLTIQRIPSDRLRATLAAEGLFEGGEVQCGRDARGRVLLTTPDKRRIALDETSAVRIEVASAHERQVDHRDNPVRLSSRFAAV